jgi:hypothetical protein
MSHGKIKIAFTKPVSGNIKHDDVKLNKLYLEAIRKIIKITLVNFRFKLY